MPGRMRQSQGRLSCAPHPQKGQKPTSIIRSTVFRVSQRFTAQLGLRGMGVAPTGVTKPLTGHHHLLIDVDEVDLDRPIPSGYNHVHLGNGQTEVVITLPPGRHTLQLLLGDHLRIPHEPSVMSQKITIYVR